MIELDTSAIAARAERPVRVYRLDVEPTPPPTPTQLDSWREWCDENGWMNEQGMIGLNYPTPHRVHWFSKGAADKKAAWLRRWGYEVTVVASLPVFWIEEQ